MNGFFSQVGESYRSAFDTSAAILVGRLKTNTKLSSDVYSWANKIGDIRKILDSFLRSKYCEDAKKNIKSMPEEKLRNKVIELLEQKPDLYIMFIK